MIVRFYSIQSEPVTAVLTFNALPITNVFRCNLLEERMSIPPSAYNAPRLTIPNPGEQRVQVELHVRGREIVTLELELNERIRHKVLDLDMWQYYFNDYPMFDLNADY